MSDERLYRIKTKDGAHVNEKLKEDGSRAAIQFDEDNGLQGPVDLVEVDESEYTREVYVEVERKERSFGQVMLEDAVAPALADALSIMLTRAVESGIDAFGSWMSQKVIPAAKLLLESESYRIRLLRMMVLIPRDYLPCRRSWMNYPQGKS